MDKLHILGLAKQRMNEARAQAEQDRFHDYGHLIAQMFEDAGTVFFLYQEKDGTHLGVANLKSTTNVH